MRLARLQNRMSRRIITATLLGGIVFPLVAAVMIFGCCVLPFHGLLHKALPLCHSAAAVLGHADESSDHHRATPPSSNPEPLKRPESSKPLFTAANFRQLVISQQVAIAERASSQISQLRSAITLGALRVDDDVGLAALFLNFRI